MGENVCCLFLRTLKCRDTKEHRHFGCNPIMTLSQTEQAKRLANLSPMDNDWVSIFCMSRDKKFKECKYYPKGG